MIDLHLDKRLFVKKFFPLLFDYSHRWECYMGSAGSAKSYFITQKLIIRAINEPIRILVCRRYRTTIRQTTFALFKEIIKKWKLSEYVKINESDYRITFLHNESEIIFIGLDDETKLLSLHNIGTIFIEEAYEVPYQMVEQLNLRMRGTVTNQQIIMAWNPINKNHWLYEFVENPPKSLIYVHSTYKDNPFLSAEYIKALEELYERSPQRARIFCDGEWGVDNEGLVFSNWTIEDFSIEDVKDYEHRVGMDFGYNDPTAVIESFYDRKNKVVYINNEFYKTGQTLDSVLEAIIQMELSKCKIQCDSAEPRTIDFFRRNYINAVPCIKGANSVESRILFLQNHRLIVHPRCKNVINELENFSYIKDKKTNTYTEKMTHEYSHSIDALGYAYSDIYTKGRLRTLDKGVLGL